ncbi:hypothetical protein AB0B78_34585 [Streptomyces sp. NPDC040724]|uniref:hypothetical protein n=1 Tax=Streptomyces sp. NPDC040724 TaxID=3155612 RepID=UPI0033E81837
MTQLLTDPVVQTAAIAGLATVLLAGIICERGTRRTLRREIFEGTEPAPRLGFFETIRRASRLSSSDEAHTFVRDQMQFAKQWRTENLSRTAFTTKMRLGLSTTQGSMNLGLAVACCVMALSDPLGSIDEWLPMILSDRGRTLDSLTEQVSNGSLILRITTLLVALTATIRYCAQVRAVFKNKGPAATLWRETRQLNLTNAQGGVFLSALTIVWLLQGRGIDGVWMAVLSYAFAFFIDDWIIISEYSVKLDLPALPLHKWRLRFAYICLLTPSLALAWNEFGRWGVAVMAWFIMSLSGVSLAHRRATEGMIWPKRGIPQQQGEQARVSRNRRSEDGSVQT